MKKKLTLIFGGVFLVLLSSFITGKIVSFDQADEQSVLGMLYQQRAAEYKALCFQAYNLAKERIAAARTAKGAHKPLAIITDLDETAIDNSACNSRLYMHDSTVTINSTVNTLKDWWLHKTAKAVPGAVDFFQYAYKNKIDIYYISNRTATPDIINATRENMHALGFPYTSASDNDHFLFCSPDSSKLNSKEYRRNLVEQKNSVILFLGDNLADFDKRFDYKNIEDRNQMAQNLKSKFGKSYIVFPNAVYGDWESVFYNEYKKAHPGQPLPIGLKESIRRGFLITK
ncbi:5'-nucleotidase, lipoprotein e(P4) family [Mucilaginibacter paludis]|uniref:Acid phosphatase (Class B) n=1 Tax=Mucilaginibacter paludis DSM 18603 TaxID=714943 RepID=H1Y460_9SPHI|nr:HAD family acid phosphatase [Mucilaginibacter paludis]EHQ24796.1 acid phosphatase (Class B) [Mucilaginibacter paludis DSM 18603]